jgi:NADPH:quinone reductase-like Zn-dependent oxidoreductase
MSNIVNKVKEAVHLSTSSHLTSNKHRAAVLRNVGEPFVLEERPTPAPGPNDVLISVSSLAVNPIDYYSRDMGVCVGHKPAIVGSDIGGTVVAVGDDVSTGGLGLKPGARVAAFAPSFYTQGDPDTGAFQEKVLVPSSLITALPDQISMNEAAILGMAVRTAWMGWWMIGLPLEMQPTVKPEDKKGILVWAGSSSVGNGAVQTARWMGYTVYATASPRHHEYVKSLGAKEVFDYKDSNVVQNITATAKRDGVTIQYAYDAAGGLPQITEILKALKPEGTTAKISSALIVKDNAPKVEGVEAHFVTPPKDEKETERLHVFAMKNWLKEALISAEYVPSPRIEVVDGGLDSVNAALDKLKSGASGTKLVVELQK